MATQQQQELDIETVVRWLLAQDYMTPEEICDNIEGTELIEDCVVFETTPWTCSDGTADLDYDRESCDKIEAADRYVEGGDWGDEPSGSVEISVWRWGIDANGNDCAVDCDTYDIDLIHVIDHAAAITSGLTKARVG